MQIRCYTIFDITETKITGHFKPSQIPFKDNAGNEIIDLSSWTRARNQQRNLETITQVLQLRTQIFDITSPVCVNGKWNVEFTVESDGIYQLDDDIFGILKQDCDGVPMVLGLNDEYVITPYIVAAGTQQNIWFEVVVNN